jgi:MFS family permease
LIGVVWALGFWWWFRDDPAKHSGVNPTEYALITQNQSMARLEQPHLPIPWGSVLRKANLWLLGGVISCSAFVSYLYYTWYSTYLQQGRGVSPDLASWLTSTVLTGGALGCMMGGYLNDWLIKRTGRRRVVRCSLGSGGLALATLGLLVSVRCDSPWSAAMWTSVAFFLAMVQITTWWAVVTEISGKHLGALFGLMNSMGVPGASVSVLFLGWLVSFLEGLGHEGRDRWDPAFYVYAAVSFVGAIGWMFIDATKPLVDEKL